MKQIIADQVSIIPLGRQGEHLACQIVFDLRAWVTLYGSGTAELLHQRPGDDMPYPVPLSRDGSWALWNVTDADTAQSGLGRCELRYRADDTLVKSRIWKTHIDGAMGKAAGEAPEPEQSWVNRVLEAGTAAEVAADRAEAAAVHGPVLSEGDTWMIWDPEQGTYADTGVYAGGQIPAIDPESKHWIVGGVDTGVSAVGETEESEITNDGNEREWTLLGDIDVSTFGGGSIELTGLDDLTEFYLIYHNLKNENATASGYSLRINNKNVAASVVPINSSSVSNENHGWCKVDFNGLFWQILKSGGAISATNITLSMANAQYPYTHVLNVGKATAFKLDSPVSQYCAVTGTIKIYGR